MIVCISAVLLGGLAAAGGFARLRKVLTALSFDPNELGLAVAEADGRRELGKLEELLRAEGESPEADLLNAARQPAGPRRVAAVNEVLSELASTLAWGAELPGACAKIGFLGALCLSILAALEGHASIAMLAWVLAWGAFGSIASLVAGSEARRRVSQLREDIDRLVEIVVAAAARADDRRSSAPAGVDSEPAGV